MNLHQMGAEKMPVKMPETFDSMRISSIFHNPSFTDSGSNKVLLAQSFVQIILIFQLSEKNLK